MSKDDFAAFFEASLKGGKSPSHQLHKGEVVEGHVIQISGDSVFLDVGATKDARVPRMELEDKDGKLKVSLGDKLRATVVDGEAGLCAVALGRGGIDLGQLEAARESGAPVSAKVTRAVKGGLELEAGGVRAFCPASQVEIGFTHDLSVYEGQTLEFRVLEIKDGGRSVVLSRRALLEDQRKEREEELKEHLVPGADFDGIVAGLSKHGAIVDVGGVEGFVHVSELAHRRIDRAEDVVNIGDKVEVRVLAVEQGDRGLRLRLSMKARSSAPEKAVPTVDEVLDATVVKHAGGGIIVSTAKGDGLVPMSELGLAPGADHRRAYPAGRTLKVVVVSRDPARGRLRFSAVGVARVEEQQNYRDFASSGATGSTGGSLGSLGDLLREKLGISEAPAPSSDVAVPEAARSAEPPAPASNRSDPEGVVRRKRG